MVNATMEDDDTNVHIAVQEGNNTHIIETKVAHIVEVTATQH